MEARLVSYIFCLLLLFCSVYARSIGKDTKIVQKMSKSFEDLEKELEEAINAVGDEFKNDADEQEVIMDGIMVTNSNQSYFEGDIIESEEQRYERYLGHNIQGDLINNPANYWPEKQNDPYWKSGVVIVPYTYSNIATRQDPQGNLFRRAVNQAIEEYKKKTCIRFTPRTNQANGIEFISGSGCYSFVGKQNTRTQDVSLGTGCTFKGIAIHELMHAIGYYHEQSRSDRDSFVRIDFSNINPRMAYNFQKRRTTRLQGPYDYDSVMHYSNRAFAVDRSKPTIVRINRPDLPLGQRDGLSKIDAESIRRTYCAGQSPPGEGGTGGTGGTTDNCELPTSDEAFCSSVGGTGLCAFCKYNKACPNACIDSQTNQDAVKCPGWAGRGFCKVTRFVRYMGSVCGGSCKTNCRE